MQSKSSIRQDILHTIGVSHRSKQLSLRKSDLVTIFNMLAADDVSITEDDMVVSALKQSISTACDFDYAPQTGTTGSGTPIVRSQNNRPFRKDELASIRDELNAKSTA